MKEIILLKQGEMVLKGLNRMRFEKRMLDNVKRRLSAFGPFKVYSMQSTIYVEPLSEQARIDRAYDESLRIFGAAAVMRAAQCEKDIEKIIATAKAYLHEELSRAKTFKVESKRADKNFPMTSPEISRTVGTALGEAFSHLEAKMTGPDVQVTVEIRDFGAYIHGLPAPGAGGLPVGCNGKAALLLSGGIDSPVAAYMMAKRGVELEAVHFFSYPYTSERAKEKVLELTRILTAWCGRIRVHVVAFTHIQEEIRAKCPEEMFTIVMRRFMMRIADKIARDNGCGALITGESLGQVASQTMEAMAVTGAVCALPVFRPVVGMDKEEIVTVARKIGTFETSILPYEDCCTVFTPRHPKIKPRLRDAESAETELDIAALVDEAIAATELERFGG